MLKDEVKKIQLVTQKKKPKLIWINLLNMRPVSLNRDKFVRIKNKRN
jgi:hypothetical protein